MSPSVALLHGGREVFFHPDYSCGTAAVRGAEPLGHNAEHYWEIKMTSAVYGTDMMIGVGTADADLSRFRTSFCSLLGKDEETWGLSYFGTFHHAGKSKEYTTRLERGATIGVLYDGWNGRLSFFRNSKPLGVAAEGLQGKVLFPIVTSTAARTKMRLVRSASIPYSLQYQCCASIGQCLQHQDSIEELPLPPGIRRYLAVQMDWVFRANAKTEEESHGAKKAKRKRKQ